jgi:hypothetical protein
LPPQLIERHIPWARNRHWRPGERISLTESAQTITYLLRGVMRDADPRSDFATVTLEPVHALSSVAEDDGLSAAG